MNKLPKSWCVKNDGSQLFKDTVIKHLNNQFGCDLMGSDKYYYYGINKSGTYDQWSSFEDDYFDVTLTLEEFIKLTTENMKTELLGLPIIKGEKHHLEAFIKDCEEFGYNTIIGQSPINVLSHKTIGLKNVLANQETFSTLFLGSNYYQEDNIQTFQLPYDWGKALDFMKENMDRWNKIQEENKQLEFKAGDIVVCLDTQKTRNGKKDEVYKIIAKLNKEWVYIDVSSTIHVSRLRFATPEEIEKYNNKFKIFKMTSSSGDFKLEVSKKGIYYKPEDRWLNIDNVNSICYPIIPNIHHAGRPIGMYPTQISKIDVGCKNDTLVSEWRKVYDYYKSLQ